MSRRNIRRQQQPTPAEFDDSAEIDAGANYTYDPFRIDSPDPAMKYFFAADDKDTIRPDGVHRLTREKGYRKSDKTHAGGADCVLLEIPLAEWEKRNAAKAKRDGNALRDSMVPRDGLEVLHGRKHDVKEQ